MKSNKTKTKYSEQVYMPLCWNNNNSGNNNNNNNKDDDNNMNNNDQFNVR